MLAGYTFSRVQLSRTTCAYFSRGTCWLIPCWAPYRSNLYTPTIVSHPKFSHHCVFGAISVRAVPGSKHVLQPKGVIKSKTVSGSIYLINEPGVMGVQWQKLFLQKKDFWTMEWVSVNHRCDRRVVSLVIDYCLHHRLRGRLFQIQIEWKHV